MVYMLQEMYASSQSEKSKFISKTMINLTKVFREPEIKNRHAKLSGRVPEVDK